MNKDVQQDSGSHSPGAPLPSVAKTDPKWISVVGSSRRYNRNLMLIVLLIALAMSLIQVSSVNVALSAISHATGATSSELQWILSGYALAIGVALVPSGRLGDLFGRAELFVIGLILFTLASTACGMVSSATVLNILRVVQGLAAGVFSPQITGIIQQYFQGQARAKAFSLFGFVISVSVALGPVMAGFLIDLLGQDVGWRSTFLINLPLGLAGAIAAFFWLPFGAERRRRDAGKGSHLVARRIDLDPVGTVLLVATVVMIMLPFVTHGHPWAWALLPAAVISGIAWVVWERRYAARGKEPMADLRLFTLTSFSYCNAVAALQFLGITSVFALVAIYMQQGLGNSALAAGMIGLPNAIASAVSSLWSGKYAIVYGRVLQVFAVGSMAVGVLCAAGAALLIPHGFSVWWLAVGFTIQGAGQGMMASVNQTQAMLDVPPAQGGVAGGVTQTVQRITTAIGNAMMTGIFFALAAGAPTGGAAVAPWSTAISTAYLTIGAIMIACLVVAVIYWRTGRGVHGSK